MTSLDAICLMVVVLGGGGMFVWVCFELPRAMCQLFGLIDDGENR